MKRVIVAVLILTILFCGLPYRVVADLGTADFSLIVFEDHYLDLSHTDVSSTTALVDTSAPGYVTIAQVLQKGIGTPFSFHPVRKEIAAVAKDSIKIFRFTGSAMKESVSFPLPGAESVAYSSTGNFLAAVAKEMMHIYGFDQDGTLREVASYPASHVGALSGFFGDSFLLLTAQKILCFAWDGKEWVEYTPAEISGFTRAISLSYCPDNGSLAVVDEETLRYFRWDGSAFRELFSLAARGVKGVALEPGGLRWLGDAGSVFYDTSQGSPKCFPNLDDALQGFAIAHSPWGQHDFALLTKDGIMYRGFTGASFSQVPAYSIAGKFGGGLGFEENRGAAGSGGSGSLGFSGSSRDEGVFVSKVIPAQEACTRVRLEADQIVPAGASVKYEVSTDGGVTFTEVPLNQNTPVPPGYKVVYKIILKAGSEPPKVDRIRLLQIGTKIVPATLIDVNGRSRVRLVR